MLPGKNLWFFLSLIFIVLSSVGYFFVRLVLFLLFVVDESTHLLLASRSLLCHFVSGRNSQPCVVYSVSECCVLVWLGTPVLVSFSMRKMSSSKQMPPTPSIRVQSNYEELNIIGTGAYGTVYRARDRNNPGNIVALKKVRVALTDDGVPMSTLREISLLKQLDASKHPNIVKLLEVCQLMEREGTLVLFLVFEHLEQDLSDLIERLPKSGMPPTTIQRLSRELLTGVDFLHSHRIIHRDLKPQNLLISSQGHLKIADFGLAKTYDFDMKLTSVVVTLWYRAPEILLGQPYNSAVDVWSAACIIAEMFARKPLFPGTSEGNQLDRIFELTGRPSSQQWPKEISLSRDHFPPRQSKQPSDLCPSLCEYSDNLLSKMLSFDHRRRPSALACLGHEYFQQEPL